jgi:hypothetical protein
MASGVILAAGSMAVALVPVLVSGSLLVYGGYLTFTWNAEKARLDLLRQKLEEVFTAVQVSTALFHEEIAVYNKAVTGVIQRAQVEEELAKIQHDKSAFRTCRMLINLYFPELRSQYDSWSNSREVTLETLSSPHPDDGSALGPIHRCERTKIALEKFLEQRVILQDRLAEIAPTLLKPKLLRWPWI